MCGAKKLQGLNLNANSKLSFAGKLSCWLKGVMWAFIFYIKRDQLYGNTCLVGAFPIRIAILQRARDPLAKYVSWHVTFRLSIASIKYNDWTVSLLKLNYHERLVPL